jgi:hypothetical protein
MARQFREQLEEEVQLEQARKSQRAAPAPPVEPVAAAAPHAPGNGAADADPTAGQPAQAGGADERRT